MMFALVRRMISALGRGFVRLGRCWAAQLGLTYTVTSASNAHLAPEQEETEHWDWSIPYLWYEASH